MNKRILEIASKADEKTSKTDTGLEALSETEERAVKHGTRRWTTFDYVRCGLPLLASVIATWASIR